MSDSIIAFKEWADVCDLLADGSYSMILRKGGIHEGREGFSFKHEKFLLFSTGFHQKETGLVDAASEHLIQSPDSKIHTPVEEGNEVVFKAWAEAEFAVRVRDKALVDQLAPFHCWPQNVVDDRYSYSEKLEADCISVAFVRVFRLAEPWTVPYQRKFGGCRSWLELEGAPSGLLEGMTPVVDDATHAERAQAVRAVLGI
ncbi:DUF1802 family protein [Sulfuriroseicoccus oceanibius]|uniref:DUF1802 family protein n=1 Tax=Sulfuriroseicoccus oceanibius TaxID=2707525 RepID=A0A6B3LG27_9BACT|nr:DUF1802 family protein [Sulfuriroseicoccus oceanibius]QQL44956.1 DUF1802 family protein [Sulfuriroseicoccus oceanibius]